MSNRSDYLVIGAGISGAAAAAELAEIGSVTLVEMEERPGYHSSGRSAALYTPNYGPPAVRSIVAASAEFYRQPMAGFADHPLLKPRQAMSFVPAGFEARIDEAMAVATPATPLQEISPEQACKLAPLLRREAVARAVLDPHVMDMDAGAIHQGFLKLLKHRGGKTFTDHRIAGMDRSDGMWRATTSSGARFDRPAADAAHRHHHRQRSRARPGDHAGSG
jgi:D-arginine dehydrogenase